VLAYLFWHRPLADADAAAYEQSLERFHRSLAHQPPSGLRGSAAFRIPQLPWLPDAGDRAAPGYEDWYLVDDWAALGVLEEAAVSRGHVTAHDAIASHTGAGSAAVYRLLEGSERPADGEVAVWVAPTPGHERLSLGDLLADGLQPERDGLWRRCLVLGPAPEYCVLARSAPAGVATTRLPSGWTARTLARELVWSG
jgi:hypothetical protein